MWHCSAASKSLGRLALASVALRHLYGVGRTVVVEGHPHEWHEWTGYAYHVRRRLTVEEQETIGDVLDCRGTDEWQRRFDAMGDALHPSLIGLAMEERRA